MNQSSTSNEKLIGLPKLTKQQETTLQEFEQRVKNNLPTIIPNSNNEQQTKYIGKSHLIRLLIARDWNQNQSFEMWKRWVQWRIDFRADNILESEIESELKLGKAFWHGKDKLGNPCLIIRARNHFPGQATHQVLMRFFIYLIEKGIQMINYHFQIGITLADESGTGKVTVIWDRGGVSYKNFDKSMLSLIKQLFTVLQDNYAERLHMAIILYPNFLVRSIMTIMWPFLSEKSKSKIKMAGDKKNLKEFFTNENLIIEHGGTSTFEYNYNGQQCQQTVVVENKEDELQQEEIGKQLIEEIKVNDLNLPD